MLPVLSPLSKLLLDIFVMLYIFPQRFIGAAKTSTYYAINPFIATIFSLVIFFEIPQINYLIALVIMIIGAFLAFSDKPLFKKKEVIKNDKEKL